MNQKEILSKVDHTLLSTTATWKEIQEVLEDAIHYETASACIPPAFVKQAKNFVGNKMKICTVIGFPNGYATTSTKVFETEDAIQNGADEIDMVINLGFLKEKQYSNLEMEIRAVQKVCRGKILKVIVEICMLTEEEIITMCEILTSLQVDYIKTSTGFSSGGATPEAIALMKKYAGKDLKIKAAGGISSFEDAKEFICLGADRLGTSRLIKLLK